MLMWSFVAKKIKTHIVIGRRLITEFLNAFSITGDHNLYLAEGVKPKLMKHAEML